MKKIITAIVCVGLFVFMTIYSLKSEPNNNNYNSKYEYEIEELEAEISHLEDENKLLEIEIEELQKEIDNKEEEIKELHQLLDKYNIDEWKGIDIPILVDGAKIEK